MSNAESAVAAAPSLSWPSVDALEGAFGGRRVRDLLASTTSYLVSPALGTDGAIHATLGTLADRLRDPFASRMHQHDMGQVDVRVVEDDSLICACNCRATRWGGGACDHALALALDLAIHPPLAAAVLAGQRDVSLELAQVPAARAGALSERAALDAIARWMAPQAVQAIELAVEPVREAPRYSFEAETMLVVRVRRVGQRACLSPRDIAELPLSDADRRLLQLTDDGTARKAVVARPPLAAVLLSELASRGEIWTGQFRTRGTFSRDAVRPRLSAERRAVHPNGARPASPGRHEREAPEATGDVLSLEWVCEDSGQTVPASEALLVEGPSGWLWSTKTSTFHPVARDVNLEVAGRLQRAPVLSLPPALRQRAGSILYNGMRGRGVALPPRQVLGLPRVETPRFLLRLAGSPLAVRGHLDAVYAARTLPLPAEATPAADERDLDGEAAAVALVHASALSPVRDAAPGEATLAAEGEAAIDLWQRGIVAVRASEAPHVEVELSEALSRVRIAPPLRARVHVGLVGGWLDANVELSSEDMAVEIEAVRAALARGSRWVTLSDGALARIADTVGSLANEVAEVLGDDGSSRLPVHQLGRLARWVDEHGGTVDAAVSAFRARLRALAVSAEPCLPASLTATLRAYQLQGLAWLQWLEELGAGGILADDMGLGKTLMALALLAAQKQARGPAPSLVVCPTSVAPGWVREAARFTPDLRVYLYHGAGREEDAMAASDVVVTTYALLRSDIDKIGRIDFRTLIADEAQNIKNPDAATTLAAKKVRATHRLALSGTPVENRLRELWSIVDFVNPGMLGTARAFESRFERPIAAAPAGPVAAELRAVLRPFVLRRTKEQVLRDLPPKTEIERTCTLGPAQKRLYDALALTLRESVANKIAEVGIARAGLNVLTALLRLRQMACDPRLVDPLTRSPSAKRAAFLEIVRELAAEGRRALVFSQFVELLKLWRADLDAEGIAYEYLDGSTGDRAAVVDRFQQGTAPLFLISLKAGGAGLNLTAADTVVHCDPWWNPAVEDQATDRAHRMGQERPVTVVRLVAKGTVEDKIGVLKAAKRELADAVVGAGAEALRGLTEGDLESLLGASEGDAIDELEPTPAPPPVEVRAAQPQPGSEDLETLRVIARRWLARTGRTQGAFGARVGMSQTLVSRLVRGQPVRLDDRVARRIRGIEVEVEVEAG